MIATRASLVKILGDYPHINDLLDAFDRSCGCMFDSDGLVDGQPCSSCQMSTDTKILHRLLFVRTIAVQVQAEEGVPTRVAA